MAMLLDRLRERLPVRARTVWLWAGVTAVLWPARVIGPLDGVPLDGVAEATLIGVALPWLWWLTRDQRVPRVSRIAIVALLSWKILTAVTVQQQGLCMRAVAPVPLDGAPTTIMIQEPLGFLRSWDARAPIWDERPACTAIITRALPDTQAFPAWFVNITDQMIGRREFTIDITGFVTTRAGGTLSLGSTGDAALSGTLAGFDATTPVPFAVGSQPVAVTLAVKGEAMRFVPELDGRSLWGAALMTVTPPRAIDRLLAPWAWTVAPALCLLLIGGLIHLVWVRVKPQPAVAAWMAVASAAAIGLALAPPGIWQRAAGLITLAAVLVPVRARLRNLHGAFFLLGVPWLAFCVAYSLPSIGRFSLYSYDDWLLYQLTGYRIFLNGYWIEAGTLTFDTQPLYRWVTGFLHLIFGDSSVGEFYWDASCLLIGALLAFHLVRATAGFKWGVAAAAATLATFTVGTPWYFVGRGLSEITAAGCAFLAMFGLLRARLGSHRWLAWGTAMAVAMFLARLNHLLWVLFLPAMLLPLRTSMDWRGITRSWRQQWKLIGIYAVGFMAALLLFIARTWYYTGHFSLFYGTSLRFNDTGLRPWTVFDWSVWPRVGHSLYSLGWMNEPPRPDPRAVIMVAGMIIAVAALLRFPIARRLPAALVVTAAGAAVGAFLAHAHGYPGRFSIHALPLASALTMIATARVWRR